MSEWLKSATAALEESSGAPLTLNKSDVELILDVAAYAARTSGVRLNAELAEIVRSVPEESGRELAADR